ncbi:MAG: ABC transporter substrate-binding protein [Janthinobacterium lividum]
MLTGLAIMSPVRAADALPTVIRIGAPAIGVSGQQVLGGTLGIARSKGWIEDEFKRDGIRFEYPGFKGGAPMVGQALANGQIDFAWQGDLLSVIGKSAGLNTRLILPFSKMLNAYLVVAPNSSIHSISDLRGKRVAFSKGNQIHLQVIRILAANGMTENDIRSINLDFGMAVPALVGGDIDAAFGGPELLAARDRGVVKVAYSTRGLPFLTSYNGLLARQDFLDRYPQVAARLVKVLVRAAQYASDPAHRAEVAPILAGVYSANDFAEDMSDRPWADRLSPLLDPFLVAHYQATQEEVAQLGLLRGPKFDVAHWVDPEYVDAALRSLHLENYWAPLGADGRPLAGH